MKSDEDFEALVEEECNEIDGSLRVMGAREGLGEDPTLLNLANFDGLDSLRAITGVLEIENNDDLTSLAGLENLTEVRGLEVSANDVLTSLSALDELTSVRGNVDISGNDALKSFAGLENLEEVAGSLHIAANAARSLRGLENLSSIGSLTIQASDLLTSLDGLENVRAVDLGISIFENDALTTLGPLHNWPPRAVQQSIFISWNAGLPQCEVDDFDREQTSAVCQLPGNCSENGGGNTCDARRGGHPDE